MVDDCLVYSMSMYSQSNYRMVLNVMVFLNLLVCLSSNARVRSPLIGEGC